jgi:hypothetical protein
MEDDQNQKPEGPTQSEPDSWPADERPRVPPAARPELLNPQTEGIDRAPEIKKKEE